MVNMPQNVIIIDSDTSMLSLLKTNLYGMGNSKSYFHGGKACAELSFSQRTSGLIILDWKIKDAKSLSVFQIIRSKPKFAFLPVLITSGLLSTQDFSALDEFPCVDYLEKPFTKMNLTNTITRICKDRDWFNENLDKINKMFNGLMESKGDMAAQYLGIIGTCRKPQALIIAASRQLRNRGYIDAASKLVIHGLNLIPNEPSLLGEMAKIHFINGDLVSSKHAVKRSLSYSPDSIERLVFSGEVNLNLNDFDEAQDSFRKVLNLDSENEIAQIGNRIAKSAKADNISLAVSEGASPRNLAGLLNMVGITKVRSEEYSEGFKQYNIALGLVDQPEDKQKIFFNLSLGNLRSKNFDDAERYLHEVVKLGGKLGKKAEKHVSKLDSL